MQLAYDAGGNRRQAAKYESGSLASESYTYDANNRLVTTNRGGSLTSARSYDAAGRVTEQFTYSAAGTLSERRTSSYNANGWLTQQDIYNGGGSQTQQIRYTAHDQLGNVKTYQVGVYTGTAYTNYYSYSYARYDGYQESQVYGSSSYFQPGTTASSYDINGNVVSVSESFATSKSRSFVTDQSGHILQKTENGKTQNYFYANDKALGSSGALGTADFDYNYTPVSAQYPAATPGSYVVSAGDSLRSIALAVYGDAQLWYLIADANGLKTDADLQVGRNLSISNKVTNLRNAYDSFKPYAPGQIIGDTTPTLPEPPPPPAQSSGDGGCGGMGSVFVVIIAIVVAVAFQQWYMLNVVTPTAEAASAAAWAIAGEEAAAGAAYMGAMEAGQIAAGVIGGALGSVASQTVGMALGIQDNFSWKSVALGAIGGGVSAGLSASGIMGELADALGGFGGRVAGAALQSMTSQGIGVAVGLQEKFDWKGVAASAVGAAMSYGAGQVLPKVASGNALGGLLRSAAVGMAGGAAQQLVYGGKANWGTVAADAFGNAIGNSVVGGMTAAREAQRVPLGYADGDLGNGINPFRNSEPGLKPNGPGIGYQGSSYDDADNPGRDFAENAARLYGNADGDSISAIRASALISQVLGETMDDTGLPYGEGDQIAAGPRATRSVLERNAALGGGLGVCTPDNLYGLARNEKALADYVIRNPLSNGVNADDLNWYQRQYIEGGIGIKLAQTNSPSAVPSDGVSRDPYERTRSNLAMAYFGPPVAAAVLIPASAMSISVVGAVYSTVGPWGAAGIGFATASGMDASLQYRDSGAVRLEQSLFAGAVGAASGPIGATSGLWTNIVLGGTGSALNTSFQNLYFGDGKSLTVPTLIGAAFGAGGYYAGMATTRGLNWFKPEIYYANLNRKVPALFQQRAINIVPGALGVSFGGIVSGTAPLGENAVNDLFPPPPNR